MGSVVAPQSASLPLLRPCPECQRELPVDPRCVTWCDHCGWNVQPDNTLQPRNLFEQLYLSLGQAQSKQLFAAMTATTTGQSRPSLTTAVAISIAVAVHCVTIMLAIAGCWLLLRTELNPFLLLLGVLCLGLAWIVCPRLNREPASVASPDQFPVLYQLTNQIAQQLGAKPVRNIVIDHHFNASFHEVGWRQQPVVTIGLPLFAILTPQEQIAILAHELAHGVNGDPRRGFLIGSAVRSLQQWHQLCLPDSLQRETGRYAIGTTTGFLVYASQSLANVLMRGCSRAPWLGAYLLSHLLWRDSQRAEYYADWLAARVGGTAAALTALDKLHLENVVARTVQHVAIEANAQRSRNGVSFVKTLRRNVAQLPAREVERIRRVETLQNARLDVTHPPTPYRIQFLRSRPHGAGCVSLSEADAVALEQELFSMEQRIARELVDQYCSHLYY